MIAVVCNCSGYKLKEEILKDVYKRQAPEATIRGAVKAIKEINSEIILVGNEEKINKKVKELYLSLIHI